MAFNRARRVAASSIAQRCSFVMQQLCRLMFMRIAWDVPLLHKLLEETPKTRAAAGLISPSLAAITRQLNLILLPKMGSWVDIPAAAVPGTVHADLELNPADLCIAFDKLKAAAAELGRRCALLSVDVNAHVVTQTLTHPLQTGLQAVPRPPAGAHRRHGSALCEPPSACPGSPVDAAPFFCCATNSSFSSMGPVLDHGPRRPRRQPREWDSLRRGARGPARGRRPRRVAGHIFKKSSTAVGGRASQR